MSLLPYPCEPCSKKDNVCADKLVLTGADNIPPLNDLGGPIPQYTSVTADGRLYLAGLVFGKEGERFAQLYTVGQSGQLVPGTAFIVPAFDVPGVFGVNGGGGIISPDGQYVAAIFEANPGEYDEPYLQVSLFGIGGNLIRSAVLPGYAGADVGGSSITGYFDETSSYFSVLYTTTAGTDTTTAVNTVVVLDLNLNVLASTVVSGASNSLRLFHLDNGKKKPVTPVGPCGCPLPPQSLCLDNLYLSIPIGGLNNLGGVFAPAMENIYAFTGSSLILVASVPLPNFPRASSVVARGKVALIAVGIRGNYAAGAVTPFINPNPNRVSYLGEEADNLYLFLFNGKKLVTLASLDIDVAYGTLGVALSPDARYLAVVLQSNVANPSVFALYKIHLPAADEFKKQYKEHKSACGCDDKKDKKAGKGWSIDERLRADHLAYPSHYQGCATQVSYPRFKFDKCPLELLEVHQAPAVAFDLVFNCANQLFIDGAADPEGFISNVLLYNWGPFPVCQPCAYRCFKIEIECDSTETCGCESTETCGCDKKKKDKKCGKKH